MKRKNKFSSFKELAATFYSEAPKQMTMIVDLQTLETHPAIKRHQLGAIVADMGAFNGWIRCKTSMPNPVMVIVTDGKYYSFAIWINQESGWDNDTYLPNPIIAWRLTPEIPQLLKENC